MAPRWCWVLGWSAAAVPPARVRLLNAAGTGSETDGQATAAADAATATLSALAVAMMVILFRSRVMIRCRAKMTLRPIAHDPRPGARFPPSPDRSRPSRTAAASPCDVVRGRAPGRR